MATSCCNTESAHRRAPSSAKPGGGSFAANVGSTRSLSSYLNRCRCPLPPSERPQSHLKWQSGKSTALTLWLHHVESEGSITRETLEQTVLDSRVQGRAKGEGSQPLAKPHHPPVGRLLFFSWSLLLLNLLAPDSIQSSSVYLFPCLPSLLLHLP